MPVKQMNLVRLVVIYLIIYAVISMTYSYAGGSSGGHSASEKPRVNAAGVCLGYGPQSPRDVTKRSGINRRLFHLAPPADRMNLCNIHTHTNAEHKGPGYSIFAGRSDHGGFKCNASQGITTKQRSMPEGQLSYGNAKPGDTIEVHWVFTSCDVEPGEGLSACVSSACVNPQLRVESQAFLLVNDRRALDFRDFDYDPHRFTGYHQPRRLPQRTGTPIVYSGSTTGTKYDDRSSCSPFQVTWSVRPRCAMLDILTLNEWGNDNVFGERGSHGVRPIVTALDLLSPIE